MIFSDILGAIMPGGDNTTTTGPSTTSSSATTTNTTSDSYNSPVSTTDSGNNALGAAAFQIGTGDYVGAGAWQSAGDIKTNFGNTNIGGEQAFGGVGQGGAMDWKKYALIGGAILAVLLVIKFLNK